jgi:adenine deaminase
LSPLQAIRSATFEPAWALGLQRTQGTIGTGERADLVVLDANPLADIRNTQRIHAVLVGGQLITSERRQRLLDVAALAANPPGAAPTAGRTMAGCGCHAHSA